MISFSDTIAPPFGTESKDGEGQGRFPGLPSWVDLNIIVPVVATIIVICVGILVVCVALTRRKHQPMMPPGSICNNHKSNRVFKQYITTLTIVLISFEEICTCKHVAVQFYFILFY